MDMYMYMSMYALWACVVVSLLDYWNEALSFTHCDCVVTKGV